MSERAVTVDAIARVLSGAARAEHEVPAALAALPELDNDGRARVARRIYGVCVLRLRLRHLARLRHDDAAGHLDAYVRFEEEGAPVDDEAAARWYGMNYWAKIASERSCPPPLVELLASSLELDGADAFLAACNVPGPRVLRANTLRITRDALAERLRGEGIATSPGKVSPLALVVEGRANLFGCASWRAGLFEVQDEASQTAALACAAKPGDVVVDLCAGRGGKTLALAAQMEDRGRLWVNDVDEAALKDMQPRLRRAGVTCARRGLPEPASADVVLVDAPCTSLGTLRRSPDLRFTIDLARIPALTALQRHLLDEGARLVRPGGRLVYATCSVLRAENADVAAAFLAAQAGFAAGTWRTWTPQDDGTDGFFVAAFQRRT